MIANIFANLVKYLIWYPLGTIIILMATPFIILMNIVVYSNRKHTKLQKDEFNDGLIKYIFREFKEFAGTWYNIHLN